ncbi:MAG: nucleotide sugar dehydrogenase [Candidatus Omnitrophica bacterium]|nr:nucleotide sugar dehydrogenase [Candidatus Omnitrophota bacterium]
MSTKSKQSGKQHPICVIGAGHVGLVAAACFAEMGNNVVCVDNDKKKIEGLKKKNMPFYEPGLEPLVKKNMSKKRLRFSSSLSGSLRSSEVVFIAVGTPPQADGSADLTALEHVARNVADALDSYKLIVEKSTVPVQTGLKIKETISRYRTKEGKFDVASNPEFLREGKAVYDFFHPDRIVLGVESAKAERILKDIYHGFKAPIVVTSLVTAELIKHASNSFLAMKISYMNAVARVCDLSGAQVEKVAQAMGYDRRIGKEFLRSGIGYGGFCFPKDVEAFQYISGKLGYEFRLLREVKAINDGQPVFFLNKIREHLWVLKGKRIAVWGLSFKPDTDDMRFAPSVPLIGELLAEGARVYAYDPQAAKEARQVFKDVLSPKGNFVLCKTAEEAASRADCLCLLTEWEEFRTADWNRVKRKMAYPLLADGRNMLDPGQVKQCGFHYIGIGRKG